MATEMERGTVEQSKMDQMDADLIAEYRMSSMEDDIRSRIARDLESELNNGQLEDDFKAKLARVSRISASHAGSRPLPLRGMGKAVADIMTLSTVSLL